MRLCLGTLVTKELYSDTAEALLQDVYGQSIYWSAEATARAFDSREVLTSQSAPEVTDTDVMLYRQRCCSSIVRERTCQ